MPYDYSINGHGLITDPGKFESEPLWAPYFYDAILNGCCDMDYQIEPSIGASLFIVSDADIREFPALANVYGVALSLDSHGFVHSMTYSTKAEFDATVALYTEDAIEYMEGQQAE